MVGYEDAYRIARDAVDAALFGDRDLLDAYNEMLSSPDGSFADRVADIVLDLENEAREAAEGADGEEAAELAAEQVAESGADEATSALRACMAEAGIG